MERYWGKMMRIHLIAAAVGLSSTAAQAAPVDLSGWLAEGTTSFNWNLESGNNGVVQLLNGNPTVFHNNQNSQGNALAGTIEVQTPGDDDFIGFVLGFQSGDFSNPAADYILIDWKQSDQFFHGGTAEAGLALSRVSGVLDDDSGAWWHDPSDGVTEIQRAANLGNVGWTDDTEYSFELTFTSSLIEVAVNGVTELSVTSAMAGGPFANGSFGFYNYSQSNVRYAGITEDALPPAIPVPAALPLMATGLAGFAFAGLRRRR